MRAARVTLVTGGARRLGAAIVRSFAERGDSIVLHHGHSSHEAETLAAELRANGTSVLVVQEDLQDSGAPARLVAAAINAFDKLDVVVSSASVMTRHQFGTVTTADWETVERVNLQAPFFLMQAAASAMSDGGVIIQISDHLAFETGFPTLIPHQVTKSALTQLVRSVAATLAPSIRVNAVAPGLVLAPDDMDDAVIHAFLRDVPMARIGNTDDVLHAIHYLVSASYVTGVTLAVDGGRHLRR